MALPEFVIAKTVSLKNHAELTERWLHEYLVENTALLGLGDLEVRDSERRQPSGGRLDLLLQDVETSTRYEVEIQLGAVDESHIIRTIEYWDIERRRYPQYQHVAVIVAENVTSRFLNVISLLNRSIPLIAIQINCVKVNESHTLIATRVVDLTSLGTEEEDEGEAVDRALWEQKASKQSLDVTDELANLIRELQPDIELKYNKHYIGLEFGGKVQNFVVFRPRKSYVLAEFKIPSDHELDFLLDTGRLEVVPSNALYGTYRVNVREADITERLDALKDLVRRAHEAN